MAPPAKNKVEPRGFRNANSDGNTKIQSQNNYQKKFAVGSNNSGA